MPNNSLFQKFVNLIFTKKLYLQNLPCRLPPPEKKIKILVSVNKWYVHKYHALLGCAENSIWGDWSSPLSVRLFIILFLGTSEKHVLRALAGFKFKFKMSVTNKLISFTANS